MISNIRRRYLMAVVTLAALVGTVISGGAGRTPVSAAPAAANSLFADAVRALPARLNTAREAAKRGEHELAIHEYLASIQEDASTAEPAIAELVEIFLSNARLGKLDGQFVDESRHINQCYQTLLQLKEADARLPESARIKLFQEIRRVRTIGNESAKVLIVTADELRTAAKGKHWWNRDDRNNQAEALHRINLAWSYYPAFEDEWMISKMYEIWADMKGELPTWQYNQVMERDRLQLGRVVGDR